ncbi:hypothetical protein VZT92_020883 [Zoarces viviparus]|uniref:4Fe-4S ferredoxin-type domain-containing protein n=1 Tax=Zoarces viviparus TaxID=48416 RepID=A0AAW1EEX9_ZOAVI
MEKAENMCYQKLWMAVQDVRDTKVKWPPVAASPDGPVSCLCCGICEIKCPLTAKCMTLVDDRTTKRRSLMTEGLALACYHDNFHQAQCQLDVCEVKYCDFIVQFLRDVAGI